MFPNKKSVGARSEQQRGHRMFDTDENITPKYLGTPGPISPKE